MKLGLNLHLNFQMGELPGGPVVRILYFHYQGVGSIPGWGHKILHATQLIQKKKKKIYIYMGEKVRTRSKLRKQSFHILLCKHFYCN